jgi:hypothetical protein
MASRDERAMDSRLLIGSGEPWQYQEAPAREAATHLRGGSHGLIFGMDSKRWEEIEGNVGVDLTGASWSTEVCGQIHIRK